MRTAEEIKTEIAALKTELKLLTKTDTIPMYVETFPFSYGETLEGVAAGADSGYSRASTGVFNKVRCLALEAFRQSRNRAVKVKDLSQEQKQLAGALCTEIAEVYNKYWVQIRENDMQIGDYYEDSWDEYWGEHGGYQENTSQTGNEEYLPVFPCDE